VAFGVLADPKAVAVYDAATAWEVRRLPSESSCRFSPDGRLLFIGHGNSYAVAKGTWEKVADLGPGSVNDCPPDGEYAVLGLPAGIYRLVRVAGGRELAWLEDTEAATEHVQFTPDGTKVIARAGNGMRVWDLRRIRAELANLGLDWDAPAYASETAESGRLEVRVVGDDPTAGPGGTDRD
jgi:hypothetical protein